MNTILPKDGRVRSWEHRQHGMSDVDVKIALLILGFLAVASLLTLYAYVK